MGSFIDRLCVAERKREAAPDCDAVGPGNLAARGGLLADHLDSLVILRCDSEHTVAIRRPPLESQTKTGEE